MVYNIRCIYDDDDVNDYSDNDGVYDDDNDGVYDDDDDGDTTTCHLVAQWTQ